MEVPTTVFCPKADLLVEQAIYLNTLSLHNRAIQLLNQSIQLNPYNRNAYIERALAYFELNQLKAALNDYAVAEQLTLSPPYAMSYTATRSLGYITSQGDQFVAGLVMGTFSGIQASAVDTMSCFHGILNGLWALACSPKDVSLEMIMAAYAFGKFIATHNIQESFYCMVPEFQDLHLSWDKSDDYSRGQKLGYIIGKYGVNVFLPFNYVQAVSKTRALRRASAMCTLQQCAASKKKQAKIMNEVYKRAVIKEAVVTEAVKKGKLLVHNANVKHHVMQKKHAWDKLLPITGDLEKDFQAVLNLLNEHAVASHLHLKDTQEFTKGILRREYVKVINDKPVKIMLIEYTETGKLFLMNGWVITR
jgi:hypothetical protein